MSLEAIKLVADTERSCAEQKNDALLRAKKLVADAEKAGQALLEQRRAETEDAIHALVAEAERAATEEAKQAQTETLRSCDVLRSVAQQQLKASADLIVRRVVNLP